MGTANKNSKKKTNRRQGAGRVRVVGKPRREPDARRLARAIIRLSLDEQMGTEDADDRLDELAHEQRGLARQRREAHRATHDQPETDPSDPSGGRD
jgi:hypothetical protein